jgi:hypothetical protein
VTAYWIRFDLRLSDQHPIGVLSGVGVTAHDRQDALALVKELVFGDQDLPIVLEVQEGIDISKLDQKHVVPNMGNPLKRGVWFPLGYS